MAELMGWNESKDNQIFRGFSLHVLSGFGINFHKSFIYKSLPFDSFVFSYFLSYWVKTVAMAITSCHFSPLCTSFTHLLLHLPPSFHHLTYPPWKKSTTLAFEASAKAWHLNNVTVIAPIPSLVCSLFSLCFSLHSLMFSFLHDF